MHLILYPKNAYGANPCPELDVFTPGEEMPTDVYGLRKGCRFTWGRNAPSRLVGIEFTSITSAVLKYMEANGSRICAVNGLAQVTMEPNGKTLYELHKKRDRSASYNWTQTHFEGDPLDKLVKIKGLLDQDVITQDEFASKKGELLAEICERFEEDPVDKLVKIKGLLDQDVITQDEFVSKKRKLLMEI